MKSTAVKSLATLLLASCSLAGCAHVTEAASDITPDIGNHRVSTVPVPADMVVRSATYTPSGKVLVAYARPVARNDERSIELAVMDDNGSNVHRIFSGRIPDRPKDNGLRYMVFPDNKRIFLGDFVVECTRPLESCENAALVPVNYPAQVADGDFVAHRWSEIVVAPDNRHVSWNALLTNFAVVVFTGELQKAGDAYNIVDTRIVSTLDPFAPDPAHADGVLPRPILGGEVKQFVEGGTALSLVGADRRDVPDSVVQSLITGRKTAITDTPGYTETTIFSPDEKLGITMSTRFSSQTDPAILGLMPRPYPDSLQMGLSMFAYTYAVTGVRKQRPGNVGPALIDIAQSKSREGYQGMNLSTDSDWVYYSPMSWAPDSRKAMWMEGKRDGSSLRIQTVTLPDYRPSEPVAARVTPDRIPGAISNLSVVRQYAKDANDIDVKVYGRRSGYLTYRRTPAGLIEKHYFNFSDDGQNSYSGSERMQANPGGQSTYTANVKLTGSKPGVMDLKITFGPLGGPLPAELIFRPGSDGQPLTRGYVEFGGQRIDVDSLTR